MFEHDRAPSSARRDRRPLNALCIDDEPDHVELLRLALDQLGEPRVALTSAGSALAGCEAVVATDPDLLFIDHRLPDGTAEDVLDRLRALGHEPPSIVLTAHGDEYLAARLAHAGADAYLVKRDLTAARLAATVAAAFERWRRRCEERWERKRAAALAHLATSLSGGEADALREGWAIDPETGLLTADSWAIAAAAAHRPYARAGYACGVLLVQLAPDGAAVAPSPGARLDRVLSVLRPFDVPGWHGATRLAVYAPDAGLFTLDPLARDLRDALRGPHRDDVRVGGAASHGAALHDITARAETALSATRADRPVLVVRADDP